MKKNTATLFVGLLVVSSLVVGCGQKYSDVKKSSNEFIELVQDYSADMDAVTDAKSAAKAMNEFADGMEDLIPRMQEMVKKYPELENEESLPEELKELQAKTEEMAQDMVGSMMKVMPYIQDPAVMKAQQRLGEIMSAQ